MNFNIVDPESIHINDTLNFQVMEVSDEKHVIVVIDDFLKNPDDLLSILEKVAVPKRKEGEKLYPGVMGRIPFTFPQICKTFSYVASEICEIKTNRIDLQLNLLKGGEPCSGYSIMPHVDNPNLLAFNLFLNPEEECRGGTSFYNHLPSESNFSLRNISNDFEQGVAFEKQNKTYLEEYNNDDITILDSTLIDNNTWKEEIMVDMKFNRMVIYPSYYFHSAYIEKDWFTDSPRVTLSGFLR